MEVISLQLGCFLILLYIAALYLDDSRKYRIKSRLYYFDHLLILGILNVALDAAKTYAVHHFDAVSLPFLKLLYSLYFASIDSIIFVLGVVILHLTNTLPPKRLHRFFVAAPFTLSVIIIICFSGTLEFPMGSHHRYASGVSSYTCYFMATIYMLFAIGVLLLRWNHISRHKRIGIITYIAHLIITELLRIFFPDLFVASIGCTLFVLAVYLNLESPAIQKIEDMHSETVVGFANLIETRDSSTGGHIKRTSKYVELIARTLLNTSKYRTILTNDYIKNLADAAPMHDIGKVAIPDHILQKPGKLTSEEFEIIKRHTITGGTIIRETFSDLGSKEYQEIAYNVARHHHEKWNGKGYPDGLAGNSIPLCARIMAVADVFDALSEKRCYRDALPLDQCFEIISQGSGSDFDPNVVCAFLSMRSEVEKIHQQFAEDPPYDHVYKAQKNQAVL